MIERVGNRLPHPMTLFIVGTVIVLVLSQVADVCNWSAEKTVMKTEAGGTKVQTVETVTATGSALETYSGGANATTDACGREVAEARHTKRAESRVGAEARRRRPSEYPL